MTHDATPAALHPDDGIVRPFRFAWYVAAGVGCEPFDRNAWREIELCKWRFSHSGKAADTGAPSHPASRPVQAKSRGRP
jgi:hypothetical protein